MKSRKTVLITGASSGIGKACSFMLAKAGYRVIMACRNTKSGEDVREEIINEVGNEDLVVLFVDMASSATVLDLSEVIRSKIGELDLLINNAGTFRTKLGYTDDGVEVQFGVNYLSAFYLTQLLKDLLLKSSNPRIINVASNMHRIGRINFQDIFLERNYDGVRAYAQSKLALMLFTREFARRNEDHNIDVYSVHPGAVKTKIGHEHAHGLYKYGWLIGQLGMISPEKGIKTIMHLALSDKVEGNSGDHFARKKVRRSSGQSRDVSLAEKLWVLSEKMIQDKYVKPKLNAESSII